MEKLDNWKPFSRRWRLPGFLWRRRLRFSGLHRPSHSWRCLSGCSGRQPESARAELKEAVALANQFGFALEVIQTAEFDNEDYLTNPPNRCYFCKHALFESMERLASQKAFPLSGLRRECRRCGRCSARSPGSEGISGRGSSQGNRHDQGGDSSSFSSVWASHRRKATDGLSEFANPAWRASPQPSFHKLRRLKVSQGMWLL